MINCVLTANRSETASRVIRAARDTGVRSVTMYSDSDHDAQLVREADEAYASVGTAYVDTYINVERLLETARETKADAVRPGYGFLSEIPEFTRAVLEVDMAWIGLSPEALDVLGDKIKARRLVEFVNVSPVAGLSDSITGRDVVDAFIAENGFPIATKRVDGGGGRGITAMESDSGLDVLFTAYEYHAEGSFVERLIRMAWRVETQHACNSFGSFAIVFTRDCFMRRRSRKLIEKAPMPALPRGVKEILVSWSRRLLDAVGYEGLGTCESLVEADGHVNFLEINPRLQVKHTASEEVVGFDLVEQQIRIAVRKRFAEVPSPRVHSFGFRITCEDPVSGMIPSMGTVSRLRWPLGHSARIESGINEGDVVTSDFDPMFAKLIVAAPTHEAATARSRGALAELETRGVATPASMYSAVISLGELSPAPPSTRWFKDVVLSKLVDSAEASFLGVAPASSASATPASTAAEERTTSVVKLDGRRMELIIPCTMFATMVGASRHQGFQPLRGGARTRNGMKSDELADPTGMVNSQVQVIVIRICVDSGQRVPCGDLFVVLEFMKMGGYAHAPYDDKMTDIAVETGQNTSVYQPLARVVHSEDETTKEK